MSPRAAFIRVGKLPVSSIMATLATIMMTLPPLIWAVLARGGLVVVGGRGLPILIMATAGAALHSRLKVVRTYQR